MKRSEVDSLPQKGHFVVPAKDRSAVFFSEDEVISEVTFAERPRDPPPVVDQPVNTETKKLLSETIHEGYHSPQHPPAGDDITALAKAMGVTHAELLQENRQVLQEMEQRKQQEELEELRQAVPDQSLNVARQEHILQNISAERNREAERREGGGGGGRDGDQHRSYPPDQNIAQLGWHQQNWPQSEHQQQNYYNIPGSVGIPSTTAAPAGPPHGGPSIVPPVSQPHSTQQPQGYNMAYDGQQRPVPPSDLDVGSAVQIANNDSRTGVIRWLGLLPGVQGLIAGLALVS